jgi:hypothetical protein
MSRFVPLCTFLVLGCGRASLPRPSDAGSDAGVPRGGAPLAALLAKTCALAASCPLWPYEFGAASSCVSQFERGLASFMGTDIGTTADFQRYVECASVNSDCASMLSCVTRNHGADSCQYGNDCDGDLLVCVPPRAVDCAALGEHCQTAGPFAASCTNGVSCDLLTWNDACDGNRLVQCDSSTHLESSIDCGTLVPGATCGKWVSATCLPPGPACNSFYPLRCDGDTLIDCVNGHEFAVDCTASESHCVDKGSNFACVTDATQCGGWSPGGGTPDQCTGDSLVFCVNGHVESVDCTKLGFRTCLFTPAVIADMGGTTASAKCVP